MHRGQMYLRGYLEISSPKLRSGFAKSARDALFCCNLFLYPFPAELLLKIIKVKGLERSEFFDWAYVSFDIVHRQE